MSREEISTRRLTVTETFRVDGIEVTQSTGHRPDGSPFEMFTNIGKAGSQMDASAVDFAIVVSLALQHGCPLETLQHAIRRDVFGQPQSLVGACLDRVKGAAR